MARISAVAMAGMAGLIAGAAGMALLGPRERAKDAPRAATEGPEARTKAEIAAEGERYEFVLAQLKTVTARLAEVERERDAAVRSRTAAEEKRAHAAAASAGTGAEAPTRTAASTTAKAKGGPRIPFGQTAKLPEVTGANWAEMGEAVRNMDGLLPQLLDQMGKGEDVRDLSVQIQQENVKLVKFALSAIGKLPTHIPSGNGEFTHPIVIANLIAEELRVVGRPLSEAQVSEIASLGEEYDLEWERALSSYGEETFKLEKIVDELVLKQRFLERVRAVLTPEQRPFIAIPGVADRQHLDLHSPLLMLIGVAHPFNGKTREELRDEVVKWTVDRWGGDGGRAEAVRALADRWLVDVAPALEPTEEDRANFYTTQECLASARAVLKFRKEAPAALHLDDEQRRKNRDDGGFGVPRLLKPEEKK